MSRVAFVQFCFQVLPRPFFNSHVLFSFARLSNPHPFLSFSSFPPSALAPPMQANLLQDVVQPQPVHRGHPHRLPRREAPLRHPQAGVARPAQPLKEGGGQDAVRNFLFSCVKAVVSNECISLQCVYLRVSSASARAHIGWVPKGNFHLVNEYGGGNS